MSQSQLEQGGNRGGHRASLVPHPNFSKFVILVVQSSDVLRGLTSSFCSWTLQDKYITTGALFVEFYFPPEMYNGPL